MIKKFADRAKEWLGIAKIVQASPDVEAKFLLKYDDLLIGIWQFEYSEEFKLDNSLRPLIEFADVNRTYRNKDLWQFFAMRIPSHEQAEVEEILKREHIEEDDADE